MGHERAGPLRLHHLQVVVDYTKGNLQDIKLIALARKKTPHLDEIRGQSGSGTLGLQLLVFHGLQLGLEGDDPPLRLVALLDGLVGLPTGCAML